ncbi:hypothetical protein FRB90_000640 [Tulasnella sp. 427]|nr:hypothetical protein FRB90_000640 [Tulasnella sp. 427]
MSRSLTIPLLFVISLLYVVFAAEPSSRDVIVDDENPSIVYNSEGTISSSWSTTIPSLQPEGIDTAQLYSGTAHTAQGAATASFEFTGVSIDVYFALTNLTTLFTLPTFSIDGVVQTDRIEEAFLDGNGTQIVYNALVFTKSGLTNGKHVLEISGGVDIDVSGDSFFILDYIKYTQADDRQTGPRPWVIGVTVGVCMVIAAALVGLIYWIKQRRSWGRGIYEPVMLEKGGESSALLHARS